MRFIQGFYFDPANGKVFNKDGVEQAFTFEADQFNIFNYATKETADRVFKLVRNWFPGYTVFQHDIWQAPAPNVPFRPYPERSLRIINNEGKVLTSNSGLVASSILRIGIPTTQRQVVQEVEFRLKELKKED